MFPPAGSLPCGPDELTDSGDRPPGDEGVLSGESGKASLSMVSLLTVGDDPACRPSPSDRFPAGSERSSLTAVSVLDASPGWSPSSPSSPGSIRACSGADRPRGAELARRYDVTRQSVYNDFDVLGEYVADTVGERVDLKINAVFNKAIRGLLQQKEYRKAAKTAAEFGEWVEARHEIEDIWERLEEIEDQQDTSL